MVLLMIKIQIRWYPEKVTHEDYHAAKKAHDHNLFHGHDPTHGKHQSDHLM